MVFLDHLTRNDGLGFIFLMTRTIFIVFKSPLTRYLLLDFLCIVTRSAYMGLHIHADFIFTSPYSLKMITPAFFFSAVAISLICIITV